MSTDEFYDEQTDQSAVKSAIVSKYFWAWAKAIIPTAKRYRKNIAYIDLFCGPGVYDDGSRSTPLLVLERAVGDDDLRDMLVTIFNDANSEYIQSLATEIERNPDFKSLKNPPLILNLQVGEDLADYFENHDLIPALFFIDPWGYRGVSLRLVNAAMRCWGCDCILFFNSRRIKISLTNPRVAEHMDVLFGKERAYRLRSEMDGAPSQYKEAAVIEAMCHALNENGDLFVLPFCFRNANGTISHHLIFLSKHILGYEIMKEIMARQSSTMAQGVPNFEYNPACETQHILMEYTRPIEDLAAMLQQDFAGKTLKMVDLYHSHHVGKPFIKANYKDALIRLEQENKIIANPPKEKRKKRGSKPTFADDVAVTFPKRGE